MKDLLNNWLSALNKQIGDTEEEIENRRQANIGAVKIRDDLLELIEYLNHNELPRAVERAIRSSLNWNPHCFKKE
jgi:hypothetical protein